MNNHFLTLASNIEEIKNHPKLDAKGGEITLGVFYNELTKENPTIYAFRYGMYYNPNDDFKPHVNGGQKLKEGEHHRNEYYKMLPEARAELARLQSAEKRKGSGGDVSAEIELLQSQIDAARRIIEEKTQRIAEQTNQINKLAAEAKKGGENENMSLMLKMQAEILEHTKATKHNRIEIAIEGKTTRVIEDVVHENFKKIIAYIGKYRMAVYMYGPAGTGKSETAKKAAKALGLEFYPASTITQEFKFTGYKDANGLYHDTNFYKAFKYGGLFFLDEMDSCHSDVLVGLNGAIANGIFDFPSGTEQAHPDFRVIAAGNTIGRGAMNGYTGRQAIDLSTLDRFKAVLLDYSPEIDRLVAQNDEDLINFAHELRRAAKETDIKMIMSYRAIKDIALLKNDEMFTLPEILQDSLIKGMSGDDVLMLARNMSMDNSNKYYKAFKDAGRAAM